MEPVMVLVPAASATDLANSIICQTVSKNNLSESGDLGFKRLINAATEKKLSDAKSANKRILSHRTYGKYLYHKISPTKPRLKG